MRQKIENIRDMLESHEREAIDAYRQSLVAKVEALKVDEESDQLCDMDIGPGYRDGGCDHDCMFRTAYSAHNATLRQVLEALRVKP